MAGLDSCAEGRSQSRGSGGTSPRREPSTSTVTAAPSLIQNGLSVLDSLQTPAPSPQS